jgi:hypothetical protein
VKHFDLHFFDNGAMKIDISSSAGQWRLQTASFYKMHQRKLIKGFNCETIAFSEVWFWFGLRRGAGKNSLLQNGSIRHQNLTQIMLFTDTTPLHSLRLLSAVASSCLFLREANAAFLSKEDSKHNL